MAWQKITLLITKQPEFRQKFSTALLWFFCGYGLLVALDTLLKVALPLPADLQAQPELAASMHQSDATLEQWQQAVIQLEKKRKLAKL